MNKTLTWLLAGAALTLSAGAALAAADASSAAQEAASDSARAPAKADRRGIREEIHIHRHGAPGSDEDLTVVRGGGRGPSLSAILQLRPDQQAALDAFLEATKPQHGQERMARIDRDDARTTLQRLDDMQDRMADQQAQMSRRIAAVRAFYGQLDDRQKKAFDAMPMLMMVGPAIGPMMIPHAMPIVERLPPVPPVPPVPPAPPAPPTS